MRVIFKRRKLVWSIEECGDLVVVFSRSVAAVFCLKAARLRRSVLLFSERSEFVAIGTPGSNYNIECGIVGNAVNTIGSSCEIS